MDKILNHVPFGYLLHVPLEKLYETNILYIEIVHHRHIMPFQSSKAQNSKVINKVLEHHRLRPPPPLMHLIDTYIKSSSSFLDKKI